MFVRSWRVSPILITRQSQPRELSLRSLQSDERLRLRGRSPDQVLDVLGRWLLRALRRRECAAMVVHLPLRREAVFQPDIRCWEIVCWTEFVACEGPDCTPGLVEIDEDPIIVPSSTMA